jgi:chemotaxis signal transduction protein
MINLRGEVLPVAELSTRLGHEPQIGSTTRILVVEIANGSLKPAGTRTPRRSTPPS